jgi:hypothetical protein
MTTTIATELRRLVQQLHDERAEHVKAIDAIDKTFKDLGLDAQQVKPVVNAQPASTKTLHFQAKSVLAMRLQLRLTRSSCPSSKPIRVVPRHKLTSTGQQKAVMAKRIKPYSSSPRLARLCAKISKDDAEARTSLSSYYFLKSDHIQPSITLGFYLRIRRVPFPLTYWKGDHTIVPEMNLLSIETEPPRAKTNSSGYSPSLNNSV